MDPTDGTSARYRIWIQPIELVRNVVIELVQYNIYDRISMGYWLWAQLKELVWDIEYEPNW